MSLILRHRSKSPPVPSRRLRSLVKRLLLSEGWPETSEVSLLLCNDAEIRKLNARYRGEDRPTDVLSFPQMEDPKAERARAGRRPLLGDVVISLETAEAQAKARGVPLAAEVELLLAHGLLHLLGYDHCTADEQEEMWRKQEAALNDPSDASSGPPTASGTPSTG